MSIHNVRFRPGTGSREAMRLGMLLLPLLGFVVGCNEGPTHVEERPPGAYRVVSGACGDLVLAEKIGTDSASALAAIEGRKVLQFGEGEVTLELSDLSVVDSHGYVPEPNFYGIHVLEAETGLLVHSMTEVITTEGDLFTLRWCPD